MSGTHRCGNSCAGDTDATQCGASCVSCVQPNANAACVNGGCSNTCQGGSMYQLACPAVAGKPYCSRWEFESNTIEGWVYDPATIGPQYHAGVGQPMVSSMALYGAHSMALQFQGEGIPGRYAVFVKVPLCGGQAANLSGKFFSAWVRFVTNAGSPPLNSGQGNDVKLWTGPTDGPEGMDFSVDPSTGGGSSPGSWYSVGGSLDDNFGTAATSVTHIGFRFLLNDAWQGTIYVDAINIY
jgi:hypothetical protein